MKTFVQLGVMFATALSVGLIGCGESLSTAPASESMPGFSDAEAGGGAPNANPSAGEAATDSADGAAVEDGETAPVDEEGLPVDQTLWIQLSPDDSTSMASAQIFKSGGWYSSPLKAHEFINYYDAPGGHFNAEPWALTEELGNGLDFGLVADRFMVDRGPMVDCEAGDDCAEGGEYEVAEVLFQMRAAPLDAEARRPWNIFLCVDVSGSMSGSKMTYTKQALRATLNNLSNGDKLTLVTFDSEAETIFTSLDAVLDRDEIIGAIDQLRPGSATDMLAGLNLTYQHAQEAYDAEMLHRVILFGDGNANVGDNDINRYEGLTRINGQEGIYLTGVGVGGDYDFERMDRLTDAGKGAHIFLPNSDEVDLIFGDYFTKLIEVAADQIEISMELPAGTTLESFSGEEVSTNPEERVQNVIIAAGDDMTFTARFAVEREEAWAQPVKLSIAYRPTASDEVVTQEFEVAEMADLVADPGILFERTRLVRDFAFHATRQVHPDLMSIAELDAAMNAIEGDWGMSELASLLYRLENW